MGLIADTLEDNCEAYHQLCHPVPSPARIEVGGFARSLVCAQCGQVFRAEDDLGGHLRQDHDARCTVWWSGGQLERVAVQLHGTPEPVELNALPTAIEILTRSGAVLTVREGDADGAILAGEPLAPGEIYRWVLPDAARQHLAALHIAFVGDNWRSQLRLVVRRPPEAQAYARIDELASELLFEPLNGSVDERRREDFARLFLQQRTGLADARLRDYVDALYRYAMASGPGSTRDRIERAATGLNRAPTRMAAVARSAIGIRLAMPALLVDVPFDSQCRPAALFLARPFSESHANIFPQVGFRQDTHGVFVRDVDLAFVDACVSYFSRDLDGVRRWVADAGDGRGETVADKQKRLLLLARTNRLDHRTVEARQAYGELKSNPDFASEAEDYLADT